MQQQQQQQQQPSAGGRRPESGGARRRRRRRRRRPRQQQQQQQQPQQSQQPQQQAPQAPQSQATKKLAVFSLLSGVELCLRVLYVNVPAWALRRLPELNRVAQLAFLYLFLQVIGLLWAFLINAAWTISMAAARMVSEMASHSTLEGAATFYVYYAVLRVFINFGSTASVIGWESLDDFPHAQRMMVQTFSRDMWGSVSVVTFLPLLGIVSALLCTPMLCDGGVLGVTPKNAPFGGRLLDFACNRSPLTFLRREHVLFRETLHIVVGIVLLQLTQVLLYQFPNWRRTLYRTPRATRLVLQATLLVLSIASAVAFVLWFGRSFSFLVTIWDVLQDEFLPLQAAFQWATQHWTGASLWSMQVIQVMVNRVCGLSSPVASHVCAAVQSEAFWTEMWQMWFAPVLSLGWVLWLFAFTLQLHSHALSGIRAQRQQQRAVTVATASTAPRTPQDLARGHAQSSHRSRLQTTAERVLDTHTPDTPPTHTTTPRTAHTPFGYAEYSASHMRRRTSSASSVSSTRTPGPKRGHIRGGEDADADADDIAMGTPEHDLMAVLRMSDSETEEETEAEGPGATTRAKMRGAPEFLIPSAESTQLLFQDMRLVFLVYLAIFFLRACMHPEMGFLDAQMELTILTIVLPGLYCIFYEVCLVLIRLSWKMVLILLAIAFTAAYVACTLAHVDSSGMRVLVAVHMFGKLSQYFGTPVEPPTKHSAEFDDEDDDDEEEEEQEEEGEEEEEDVDSEAEADLDVNVGATESAKRKENEKTVEIGDSVLAKEEEEKSSVSTLASMYSIALPADGTAGVAVGDGGDCAERDPALDEMFPALRREQTEHHDLHHQQQQQQQQQQQAPGIAIVIPEQAAPLTRSQSEGLLSASRHRNRGRLRNSQRQQLTHGHNLDDLHMGLARGPASAEAREQFRFASVKLRGAMPGQADELRQKAKKLVGERTLHVSNQFVYYWIDVIRKIVFPQTAARASLHVGLALGIVFSFLFGIVGVFSVMQEHMDYYPDLISMARHNHSHINIDHGGICDLHLRLFENATSSIPGAAADHLPMQTAVERATHSAGAGLSTKHYTRYAACDLEWHGLHLLDYALLAQLSYFDKSDTEMQELIDIVMSPDLELRVVGTDVDTQAGLQLVQECGGVASASAGAGAGAGAGSARDSRGIGDVRNAHGTRLSGTNTQPSLSKGLAASTRVQFVEVFSCPLNVSVIAIRGTDVGRLTDLLEDIKLYAEPVVFMLLSTVFPTIRIWPDTTTSLVIEWLHDTRKYLGLAADAEYYKTLVEYVQSIRGRNVVITGHSLGGGLARIVASWTSATSVAFSPPGIGQSHRKWSANVPPNSEMRAALGRGGTTGVYAFSKKRFHHKSIAVVPEHDPVPLIDSQVGLIQHITCDESQLAHQNACHMIGGTLCNLLKHCGDAHGRYESCNFEFDLSHIFRLLLRFMIRNWLYTLPACLLGAVVVLLAVIPDMF